VDWCLMPRKLAQLAASAAPGLPDAGTEPDRVPRRYGCGCCNLVEVWGGRNTWAAAAVPSACCAAFRAIHPVGHGL